MAFKLACDCCGIVTTDAKGTHRWSLGMGCKSDIWKPEYMGAVYLLTGFNDICPECTAVLKKAAQPSDISMRSARNRGDKLARQYVDKWLADLRGPRVAEAVKKLQPKSAKKGE